jgi:hypothetical protein
MLFIYYWLTHINFQILKEQKTECSLVSIDDKNYISQTVIIELTL